MAVPASPAPRPRRPAYAAPQRVGRQAPSRTGGPAVDSPRRGGQPRQAAAGRPPRTTRGQTGTRQGPRQGPRQAGVVSRQSRRTRPPGLAPVYDINGPRVRYGLGWFLVALPAVVLSPLSAGLVYAVAGGFGAGQAVKAWRSASWQVPVAAVAAATPVLAAAVWGTGVALYVLGAAAVVVVVAGAAEPSSGLEGTPGRIAAAGVMLQAVTVVAIGCGAMVLLRGESEVAALLLFAMVCAYEVGDFVMGSGASNAVEGPLAGALAFILVGFPAVLLLLDPFDVLGVWVLVAGAALCPVGQWMASAVLPRPDAKAPALRRVDTVLVVAPFWVLAAAAF
jgi:hypothetical protein